MAIVLLIPTIIFYTMFTVWPLVEVIRLSVYKTNFIKTVFVGLNNYINIFSDTDFITSILNSFFYMALLVPSQIIVGLFFALIIISLSKMWQDVSRLLFYVPVLSAGLIISGIWRWFFHMSGPLNYVLNNLGVESISFFGKSIPAIPIVSFIVVFSSFGGNVILFVASILSIDKSLFESAMIDGASSLQIKTKIVLPMILPMIILVGLLSAINSFQIFETIFALAPQTYAATMTYFIYEQGFMFSKYGNASAEAIVLLVIVFILSFVKRRIENASKAFSFFD